MKRNPDKKIKTEIPENPFLAISGPIIEEMDHKAFVDWAGGELSVALFRGEFDRSVNRVIEFAMMRGRLNYHQELVKKAKEKKSQAKKG